MCQVRYALIWAWIITRITHSCMHLPYQNDRKLQEITRASSELKQQPSLLKHIRS